MDATFSSEKSTIDCQMCWQATKDDSKKRLEEGVYQNVTLGSCERLHFARTKIKLLRELIWFSNPP